MSGALEDLAKRMLLDLLKAYSPTYREREAVEVLAKYAERLGYSEVVVDGVGNLIASYGRGERSLAIVGHIDTVEGYIQPRIDGRVVYGRGAVDAKGPLTAAFIGAILAKNQIDLNRWRVYVIAAVGEEGDSRGVKELIRRGFAFDGIVVAEPSNNNVVIGYRGSAKVEIVCTSLGGHTSSPPRDASACEKVVDIFRTVKSSPQLNVFKADGVSAVALYIRCGRDRVQTVYPRDGRIVFDVRIPVNGSIASVLDVFTKVVSRFDGCEMKVLDYVEPVRVSPNKPVVRALMRALILLGSRPRLVYKLGTSDMNLLYKLSNGNIAAYGPGRSELSHSDLEFIELDELLHGVEVYRNAVVNYTRLVNAR